MIITFLMSIYAAELMVVGLTDSPSLGYFIDIIVGAFLIWESPLLLAILGNEEKK